MGLFGNENLRKEVEENLKKMESELKGSEELCSDKIKQLYLKVDQLMTRINEVERQISQLKAMLGTGSHVEKNQTTVTTQSHGQAAKTIAPSSSNLANVVKLIYTGFNMGLFTLSLRLGVGDSWLKDAKANFVLECEKGQTEGIFYPNPANLKVLAFNAQSNLYPVCDVVDGVSGTIVKPGIVTLDPSTNEWKVTTKCKISL